MKWTKNGITRKSIIKDSPKSYDYLKKRFGHYKGLLITKDKNGLNQGSIIVS